MEEPEVVAEVTPSVEETPNVEPTATPETPVVETPPAEETLYELPDGRKVDAESLQREWKENFYPEYTRKSQRLAEYENINKPREEVPAWKQPDYVPKSYAEVIEIAEQQALARIKAEAEAESARVQEVSALVDSQIAELKKADPKLDENSLFLHANKYGFRDLKAAHENLRAMKQAELAAEERTVKNLKARGIDPVSISATPVESEGIDYSRIGNRNESALDFFRRITNK